MKSRGRIELGDVTHHNIKQLQRINQVVFPVSYNDRFYKDVVQGGELAKLAFFNDLMVGGMCCRMDNLNGKKRLYIMTLGCLAPYRGYGLGRMMLNHVFDLCKKDPTIQGIYLHVQVSNEDALNFYRKFGFEVSETCKNYYKRIEPSDAFLVEWTNKDQNNDGDSSDQQNTTLASHQNTTPPTNADPAAAAAESDLSSPPNSEIKQLKINGNA